jgi:hypothetical protein
VELGPQTRGILTGPGDDPIPALRLAIGRMVLFAFLAGTWAGAVTGATMARLTAPACPAEAHQSVATERAGRGVTPGGSM